MFALINSFEKTTKRLHIYNMLDYLIEKHNSSFVVLNDLVNNKNNLKQYILDTYGSLPEYFITFYGIASVLPILKELKNICKIVLINDDIHHSMRLARDRIPVIRESFINFNTYGYQLNKWNLPNVSNNYFFPHSARWIVDYNKNPINKILVSGSANDIYPDRMYVINLKNPNIDILKKGDKNTLIFGEDFYKYLSKYLCCFVDIARDYILAKVFEICASGSLLLCMNNDIKNIFEQLGFIDGENYISCTRDNIIDKINYIVNIDNRKIIDEIRRKGHELIKSKHNYEYRTQTFLKILDNNFNATKCFNSKYNTDYYLAF